ncbi:hypothetical protein [Parathalassolituus penaei]|uniref:Uncharacterized protein n=1 Tax=Parathalassolituus penaei TaxID=2997323 RepID=A0A9X3IT99_9GAMM|nr:hypothetical protein [Parathalassolituus penaei]MCY0967267.1 hypothetical protein [Parathalassolituus penaei]
MNLKSCFVSSLIFLISPTISEVAFATGEEPDGSTAKGLLTSCRNLYEKSEQLKDTNYSMYRNKEAAKQLTEGLISDISKELEKTNSAFNGGDNLYCQNTDSLRSDVSITDAEAHNTAIANLTTRVSAVEKALTPFKTIPGDLLKNTRAQWESANTEEQSAATAALFGPSPSTGSAITLSDTPLVKTLTKISELKQQYAITDNGTTLYLLRPAEQWQLYDVLGNIKSLEKHPEIDKFTDTDLTDTQKSELKTRLLEARYQLYSMLADFDEAAQLLVTEDNSLIKRIRDENAGVDTTRLDQLIREQAALKSRQQKENQKRFNVLIARQLSNTLDENGKAELKNLSESLATDNTNSLDIHLDTFDTYHDPIRRFYLGAQYSASTRFSGDKTATAGFYQYMQPYGNQRLHREMDIGIGAVKFNPATNDTNNTNTSTDETRYSLTLKHQWTWMPLSPKEKAPRENTPWGFIETSEGKIFYGPTVGIEGHMYERPTTSTDATSSTSMDYRYDFFGGYRWAVSPESYIDLMAAGCRLQSEVSDRTACKLRIRTDMTMSFDAFNNGDKFKLGLLLDLSTKSSKESVYPNTATISFTYNISFSDLYSSYASN